MSNDQKFKETLRQCRICEDNLVQAIDERVERGESVRAICQDYEDYQRQLHGEVFMPMATIRKKYQRIKGKDGEEVGTNVPTPAMQAVRLIYKAFNAKDFGTRQAYFNQAQALKVPVRDLQVELEEEARKLAPYYRRIAAAMHFFGIDGFEILVREMKETIKKIKEVKDEPAPK